MAFSQTTVEISWSHAEGKCECEIGFHQHPDGRCNKTLDWDKRGAGSNGHWEAHHLDEHPNNNTVGNCTIFCWRCHEQTF